jgi:hypothetical protein
MTPGYIVAGTAKSYVQLLFGGRLRLFVQFFHFWMIVPAAVLVLSLATLLIQIWRNRTEIAQRAPIAIRRAAAKPALRIALAWVLSYGVFLLFWLPRNTFYKLLLWPALILGCGSILAAAQMRTRGKKRLLTLWLAAQACWNFMFFVYPYSRVESNPILGFARNAAKIWSPGEMILFRTFDTDNWTIRYFTPKTVWKSLDCTGDACLSEIETERGRQAVWLDPTAIHFLKTATPATKAWLQDTVEAERTTECCGGEWPVHFLKVARRDGPGVTSPERPGQESR